MGSIGTASTTPWIRTPLLESPYLSKKAGWWVLDDPKACLDSY